MSYSDVECPYCEVGQEINHDDGYGYAENETCEQECNNCEKTFTFSTVISFSHEAHKAPCKNGGEHNLKQIVGAPRLYFIGLSRCTYCDEDVVTDKEARAKALNELKNAYL